MQRTDYESDEDEDIQRLANADLGQDVNGVAEKETDEMEEEEPKTPEAKKADLPPTLTPAEEIAA